MLLGFGVAIFSTVAAFLATQAHERSTLNALKCFKSAGASLTLSLDANRRPSLFTCLPSCSVMMLLGYLAPLASLISWCSCKAAAHTGESAAASQPAVTGGSAGMESITSTVASHPLSSEPLGPRRDEILQTSGDKQRSMPAVLFRLFKLLQ